MNEHWHEVIEELAARITDELDARMTVFERVSLQNIRGWLLEQAPPGEDSAAAAQRAASAIPVG